MPSLEFTRTIIDAPAEGATTEIVISGRFIAFEEAQYTNGSTCNTFQIDSVLSAKMPVMKNAEFGFAQGFSKLIITGGSDGGQIVVITHANPCVGYFSPDARIHPLANVPGLESIFIVDADWSYRSSPAGVDIPVLFDVSGNGNHFSHAAGGYAQKVAGGAAGSSDAHTINLPDEDTSYQAGSDLIRRANPNDPIFILAGINGGSVSGITQNFNIYGQGYGDDSASLRLMQDVNQAFFQIHGAQVARDTSRTWNADDVADDGGFHVAVFLAYYVSSNYGANVRWDQESANENNYPVGGGGTDWQVNDGTVSTIGDGNNASKGIGNADCRLGFLGAWGYTNPDYTNIPLQYVAEKYGITLGP